MSVTVSAMPRTRIDEAKARFTIPVLWRMFNLRGDPGSPCRSPFREDRSPSFSVCYENRGWKDHATGEGGDAIDFLAKIKGVSREEAFVELLNMVDGTTHQPATTTHHSAARTEPRPGPKLDGIERCSTEDLWQIAQLRSIPLVGLRLAQQRKLLFSYDDPFQGRCWLITDDARRNAIYRRLDGKRFHYREPTEDKKEGPKSRCWKGSEANWPIGATNPWLGQGRADAAPRTVPLTGPLAGNEAAVSRNRVWFASLPGLSQCGLLSSEHSRTAI